MTKRYELSDMKWNQVAHLFPPERTEKTGRPLHPNSPMFNAMVWLARSGAPWRDLPEYFPPWESVYSRYLSWVFVYCFHHDLDKMTNLGL